MVGVVEVLMKGGREGWNLNGWQGEKSGSRREP